MKKWWMFPPIGLLVIVGLVAILFSYLNQQKIAKITTFDECLRAGYPVLESYPPQCKLPNGKSYTKDIGNELEYYEEFLLSSPRPNQKINSPLKVTGQAKGMWYFEGSFSGELFDDDDNHLGTVILQSQGDWMTDDFVPFEGELNFRVPTSSTGKLIITNANPSGLSENEKKIVIPVEF